MTDERNKSVAKNTDDNQESTNENLQEIDLNLRPSTEPLMDIEEQTTIILPQSSKSMEVVSSLSFFRANVVGPSRQVHIQKYIEVNSKLLGILWKEYHLR